MRTHRHLPGRCPFQFHIQLDPRVFDLRLEVHRVSTSVDGIDFSYLFNIILYVFICLKFTFYLYYLVYKS